MNNVTSGFKSDALLSWTPVGLCHLVTERVALTSPREEQPTISGPPEFEAHSEVNDDDLLEVGG